MPRVIHEDVNMPPGSPSLVHNFADSVFRVGHVHDYDSEPRSLFMRNGKVVEASSSAHGSDCIVPSSENGMDETVP